MLFQRMLRWLLLVPFKIKTLRHGKLSRIGLLCTLCSLFLGVTVSVLFYYIFIVLELYPWNPSIDHWCEREETPIFILQPELDEITVVSMFIDIGVFKKGEEHFAYHSPYKYRKWMRAFGRLANRVVAYIESDDDINFFREIRSCFPASLTKIIKIDRNKLPSFKHLEAIGKIYSDPSYPKFYPNTVYPEYTCIMHAKYDQLEQSLLDDHFKTPYFAWLDVGYFRNLDKENSRLFKLVPPEDFDPEKIGFSQAWSQHSDREPQKVMREKKVWVSGGIVLAKRQPMLNFIRDYKLAVSELIDQGLSNTDQEVINAMYTKTMHKSHYVQIQTYSCQPGDFDLYGADARYFCLGFTCKDAWEKRMSQTAEVA